MRFHTLIPVRRTTAAIALRGTKSISAFRPTDERHSDVRRVHVQVHGDDAVRHVHAVRLQRMLWARTSLSAVEVDVDMPPGNSKDAAMRERWRSVQSEAGTATDAPPKSRQAPLMRRHCSATH